MVKEKKITKTFFKEIIATIKKNIKKFVSLVCIIFLGVGFFAGMKSSSPDMRDTVSDYFSRTNFMDIKIVSSNGFNDKILNSLKEEVDEIDTIEGGYELDVATTLKNTELAIAVYGYDENNVINKLEVIDGRLPYKDNECVVEESLFHDIGYDIGDVINLNNSNFKEERVTIVGIIRSPLYLSTDKGTTSLLSGRIDYYMYVVANNFNLEAYDVAYVKFKNNDNTFSSSYQTKAYNTKNAIKNKSKELSSEYLSDKINEAQKEIDDMEAEYNSQYNEAQSQLDSAESQISNAEEQLNTGYNQVKTEEQIEAYLSDLKSALDVAKTQLDLAKKALDSANSEYSQANDEISTKKKELQSIIDTYTKLYNDKNCDSVLSSGRILWRLTCTLYKNTIDSYQTQLDALSVSVDSSALTQAQKVYNLAYSNYTTILAQYQTASTTIRNENAKLKSTLDEQKALLDEKKEELEAEKTRVTGELQTFRNKIDDAKDQLNLLKNSDWYIYTRSDNSGYSQYYDDVNRISNLAKIFPIIFFLVAVLMTLTTISRMIEEDRTQIGTLKALGFKNGQILSKYIIYTTTASIIGSIIGITIGLILFPIIFYKIYSMMYMLPELKLSFNLFYSMAGLLIALTSTVLTAVLACKSTLKEAPAKLMKRKVAKPGKKMLLEYIPFIWNRFSFNRKITFRNLFRYKKRLIMTVVGVAGCVSLIIASFSLRDAVSNIVPDQYSNIFSMDVQLFYKDSVDRNTILTEQEYVSSLPEVKNSSLAHIENVTMSLSTKTYTVYLVVPHDNDSFTNMVKLKKSASDEEYNLSDDGVILSQKLAKLLNLSEGDKFSFIDNNGDEYVVRVNNITENYVEHYMYMTPEYYYNLTGTNVRNNTLLIDTDGDYDESEFSRKLNKNNNFSSMIFLSIAQETYNEIMQNLNVVIIVIIISAGLLAFVVLYNLASINISERKSEIATIKVLGFRKKEVDIYIKHEMKILTLMGLIFGIILSKFLAKIIINTCEVDSLMFKNTIEWTSYVVAIVITLLFATVVDLLIGKDLDNIKMMDNLKVKE